jgi:hypothetical protein
MAGNGKGSGACICLYIPGARTALMMADMSRRLMFITKSDIMAIRKSS